MNRRLQHLARVAGALVAGCALVAASAAPALAAPPPHGGHGGHGPLDVTVFARTSTCPTEVDAAHPLCRVLSWTTATRDGTTYAYVELTTEQYDPDPADGDGKTYLSDVLCNGPVRAHRRHGTITVSGRFDGCDVATGTDPGPRRFRGTVLEAGPTASARADRLTYPHSLFAAVQ